MVMEFNNLNQNKAKLKNQGKKLGISPTAAYTTYYALILLKCLASKTFGELVVKGSFSQHVHLKELTRPVLDIDLSSTGGLSIPLELLFSAITSCHTKNLFYRPKRFDVTPNGVIKLSVDACVFYPSGDLSYEIPSNTHFVVVNKDSDIMLNLKNELAMVIPKNGRVEINPVEEVNMSVQKDAQIVVVSKNYTKRSLTKNDQVVNITKDDIMFVIPKDHELIVIPDEKQIAFVDKDNKITHVFENNRISIVPKEEQMTIPINVDYKANNAVIFETQYKGVEPLFEGLDKFYINVPSFEEHLAEKLYIAIHCRRDDVLNTRVKDFYDIYQLHDKGYDPDKLTLYFQAMCKMYGEDIFSLDADFLNDEYIEKHQEIWNNMQKKYEFVDKKLEFRTAVYYTRCVLNEQLERIMAGEMVEEAEYLVRKKKNNR